MTARAVDGGAVVTVDERLASKLARIESCSRQMQDDFGRNLLHAYIACLTAEELRTATLVTLEADHVLARAFRTRLLRVGQDGGNTSELDKLSKDLIAHTSSGRGAEPRKEGLLSAIYPYLSASARKVLLDRWIDRGNLSSANRWLKAMSGDDLLRDVDLILEEWRATHTPLAAKLFIQHASEMSIADALPELIARAGEGWLISRAALKAPSVTEESWQAIREKFPATYAYLCAKLNRPLGESEAIAIVEETIGGPFGDRGLAIWSIGQMRMIEVLDELSERYDDLLNQEMEIFMRGRLLSS
ncbi:MULTISPECIES: hypothetical protein [unclassified Rhizobium]|uniref:hypothetical protein n=1 Tax=unclassified Rhizobium TaxID=2613769 RepID=UPI00161B1DB2|nr:MULTISPECIES: hypothetical protein [unclassified Rhizobium]MBB3290394.1 hypothetical protein [Rhizobium sp. BK252]MBB3405288.1 hypothetical protein [Rhizobium sp. BK289]MBB3417721.1 hypothetical protein [Rhizobium sp. BK284]MBB3485600.1 hypothetical protein [Rhizobium sp. BK347]